MQATAEFEAAGGAEIRRKVEEVLAGLGFSKADAGLDGAASLGCVHVFAYRRALLIDCDNNDGVKLARHFFCVWKKVILCFLPSPTKDFRKPCSELSGGWQMRVGTSGTHANHVIFPSSHCMVD